MFWNVCDLSSCPALIVEKHLGSKVFRATRSVLLKRFVSHFLFMIYLIELKFNPFYSVWLMGKLRGSKESGVRSEMSFVDSRGGNLFFRPQIRKNIRFQVLISFGFDLYLLLLTFIATQLDYLIVESLIWWIGWRNLNDCIFRKNMAPRDKGKLWMVPQQRPKVIQSKGLKLI